MAPHTLAIAWFAAALVALPPLAAQSDAAPAWRRGRWADPASFPIGVWLQAPRNATRYRALGIDLYVGLWEGPTQEQLDALTEAGMPVICAQNEVGLANRDNPILVGWMHGDEPDNAQPKQGGGYGPPIAPAEIVVDYERIRAADPTRPVLLNLGQGVAWDGWIGRGVRTGHPEDYAEYVKGCDVASFDIYPVTHGKPAVRGKLEFVGRGVQRLASWSGDRPVWACIETTHIGDASARPTPAQVRAEVWIALTCGARGIVYFAHEFEPKFVEAGLLAYPDIAAAVREVNREVRALAPVLNAPTVAAAVEVASSDPDASIAVLCKRHDGALYVFAANLRSDPARVAFTLADGEAGDRVEVLGGDPVDVADRRFEDVIDGYATRVYVVTS